MPQTDLEMLVFSMEADIRKLVKNMGDSEKAVESAAKHIEGRMKSAEDYVSKLFGKTNVGEALEKTFKSARFGVLEEGGTKIGIFGRALESLGPIGVVAAAAIAATALALEQVKKSLEFAEDIDKTSKALGVSTTQLQQLDFAASGTAVGVAAAREGLAQFNEVFGKYSAGLAQGRTAKFLDALGFTPESARQLGSTTEALDKVMAKLAEIGNPQQRAALADRLGLKAFLPVLAQGKEGIDAFTAAMKQAQDAGAVIAPDQIKRAAELNDKLQQLQHTAGTELKEAFIELGPVLVTIAGLAERLARGVSDLVVGFEGVEHASRRQAGEQANRALDLRSEVYNTGLAGQIDPKTRRAVGGVLSFAYNNHQEDYDAANRRMAEIDKDDAADAKTARGGQPVDLAPPKKAKAPKKGPASETNALDKTAQDELDSAAKELASALAAQTKNIQAHAAAEKQAVDADTDKKLKDLAAEEVKVRQSKNDAHMTQQLAAIQAAMSDTRSAAAAKKELIDREATDAELATYEQHQATLNGYLSAAATATASMAKTAAERNRLEAANLKADQARARQAFDYETEKNRRAGLYDSPEGQKDLQDRQEERQGLVTEQSAQTAQQTYQQAGPVEQYMRAMNSSVDQAGQKLAVQSLEQMNTALTAGLQNWKNFGSAAKSAIQSILGDMIKMSLEKAELAATPAIGSLFSSAGGGIASALGSLWGGPHAAGGTIPAGKVGLVGEKGPELSVGGASGTQIVPADLTRSLLGSIGGMMGGAQDGERGSRSVAITNQYMLTGAVSEQAVRGWIEQGRQVTLQQAAGAFRANLGSEFASFSALQG